MFLVVEREPLQARARGNEISPRPNMSSAAKEAIEDRPDDQRRSYRMLLPLLSIPCCRHSRLSTRFLTRLPARFPARFSLVFCSPLNSPLPPHFHNAARCGLSSTPILHTSHTHPPKLHHFHALPPLAPGHSLLSWPANDTRIAPGRHCATRPSPPPRQRSNPRFTRLPGILHTKIRGIMFLDSPTCA